jgi:hypothetical protein
MLFLEKKKEKKEKKSNTTVLHRIHRPPFFPQYPIKSIGGPRVLSKFIQGYSTKTLNAEAQYFNDTE